MSDQNRKLSGLTMSTTDSGLVAGTTSTYTTTVTTAGVINGKWVTTLGTQTNTASPTTDAMTAAAFNVLAPNKACCLVWGQNAAGAIKLCQGPIVDTFAGVTTTVGAFRDTPQFPQLPDDFMPLGYQLVRTAPNAANWTPGTSSWTASGVTCSTIQRVAQLPDRPQTA